MLLTDPRNPTVTPPDPQRELEAFLDQLTYATNFLHTLQHRTCTVLPFSSYVFYTFHVQADHVQDDDLLEAHVQGCGECTQFLRALRLAIRQLTPTAAAGRP